MQNSFTRNENIILNNERPDLGYLNRNINNYSNHKGHLNSYSNMSHKMKIKIFVQNNEVPDLGYLNSNRNSYSNSKGQLNRLVWALGRLEPIQTLPGIPSRPCRAPIFRAPGGMVLHKTQGLCRKVGGHAHET